MNKKQFFEVINGKECKAISNISRYKVLYSILRGVKKARNEGHDVQCEIKDNFLHLSNGQFFRLPSLPIHGKIVNKSNFITVDGMRVEKSNITIIDDISFKTENFTYTIAD